MTRILAPFLSAALASALTACTAGGGGGAGRVCVEEGSVCDLDGDGCTLELCMDGACTPTGPSCDDALRCTDDVCTETSLTTFTCDNTHADGCLIDDACEGERVTAPGNACLVCDPATDPRAWTMASGSCDDGDACTVDDACDAGSCVGAPLVDGFEPNDDFASAHDLGVISDRDSFPAGTFTATFYPDADEDWFLWEVEDALLTRAFPRAQLQNVPRSANLDLCLYVLCATSLTSIDCLEGAREDLDSMPGCCSRAGAFANDAVRIDYDCDGGDDSAEVALRVTPSGGSPDCEAEYTVNWGDD